MGCLFPQIPPRPIAGGEWGARRGKGRPSPLTPSRDLSLSSVPFRVNERVGKEGSFLLYFSLFWGWDNSPALVAHTHTSLTNHHPPPPCITPQALEKYNIEKDIAAFIKKEFDKKYNPTWHCIVGRNFGSYVTHETKHFIYFYLGQVAVLLFKSG
jgi:dynein light chain LC8-type